MNWGGGFFLGLKFVFVLIILGMEFYFLIFDKYTEGELSYVEFWFLLSIAGVSVLMVGYYLKFFRVSFLPIFFMPIGYISIKLIQGYKEKKIEETSVDKNVEDLLYTIEKQPENINAYVSLGDTYFKKENYETALIYYKKAYQINELPWIAQKIKVSEREGRIKKGEIWVCSECSFENPGSVDTCKNCGYIREPIKSIKEDLKKNKKEINKGIFLIIFVPFAIIFLLVLIAVLPLYLSLVIFLLAMYFILRKFFTW